MENSEIKKIKHCRMKESKKLSILEKSSLILAIALLVCLLTLPYGFYTLVRFTTAIIAGCWAIHFSAKVKQHMQSFHVRFFSYSNHSSELHWIVSFGMLLMLYWQLLFCFLSLTITEPLSNS